MKELSIEQKAKAYDEAIKRAEAVIKVAQNQKETYGCVTTIFPELQESEGIQTGYNEAFDSLRNQAAIAAMQGILCAPIVEGIDPNPSKEHIAELAVAQANALIEKLKKK